MLRDLAEAPGVSGHEGAVAERLRAWLAPLCDELRRDALGNLIAVKYGTGDLPGGGGAAGRAPAEGSGPRRLRLLLAAHMDEVGLMVAGITEDGFLQVSPVGAADVRTLLGQEVLVQGREPLPGVIAVLPPHLAGEEERRVPDWHQVYVDVGLPAEAVRARVRVGDPIAVRRPVVALGRHRAAGKALDDRVGLTVLWDVLRRLQHLRHRVDVYAVATVQEEVGLRGAAVAAFGAAPDAAIAIDVGWGRQPGVPEVETLELGGGPGLTLGPNVHPGLRAELVRVAQAHRIPIQVEVAAGSSGTDAWAMQVVRSGIPTAVVSIPLRAMHSPAETVDLRDVAEAGRLLAALAAEIDPQALRPDGPQP